MLACHFSNDSIKWTFSLLYLCWRRNKFAALIKEIWDQTIVSFFLNRFCELYLSSLYIFVILTVDFDVVIKDDIISHIEVQKVLCKAILELLSWYPNTIINEYVECFLGREGIFACSILKVLTVVVGILQCCVNDVSTYFSVVL